MMGATWLLLCHRVADGVRCCLPTKSMGATHASLPVHFASLWLRKGEKGFDLRLVGSNLVMSLLLTLVACAPAQETPGKQAGEEKLTIGKIASNPTDYEGKAVTLSGEYRGWEGGYGSPPVTRSDWVLKDETGTLYVTGRILPGLDPVQDRGKRLTVDGIIRVKDGRAYIEAKLIR